MTTTKPTIGQSNWGATLNAAIDQLDAADATLTTAVAAKADTSTVTAHTGSTANPHAVTKTQVGLANVDNTSDANKPVSTAQATTLGRGGVSAMSQGAIGDGTANDRAAIAAADTAAAVFGGEAFLHPGHYKVSSNLTIASPLTFAPGATLEPATGVTVTLSGVVTAPDFTTVFAGAGTVVLAKRQRVCADWWGGKGTAAAPLGTIQKAISNTAQGTRIELAGKYWTTPITVAADEDALTGDLSKTLIGIASPGVRTQTATTEWGAEVYLGNTQNADLLWLNGTVRSNGQPSRISFGIDNIKLNGNKANNATGLAALRLSQVKDIYIGRLLVESAKGRGMYVSAASNQVIARHVEAMSNDSNGIDLASLGDSHFDVLIAGSNGAIGVQIAGGTQVNQVHTYLNVTTGLTFTGEKNAVAMLRANDNGLSGVLFTGATECHVGNLLSVDNGTDTGAGAGSRSGVRFTGASYRNEIDHMNSTSTSGTPQYGVRFDTGLTGTLNHVKTYVGSGNALADVSLASGTNQVDLINGAAWNTPLYVVKPSAESLQNNTFQADDHLTLAVVAGAFYRLRAFVIYDSDATADFRIRLATLPAGVTTNMHVSGGATGATSTGSGSWTLADGVTATSLGGAGVGTKLVAELVGYVTTTTNAGNITIEWTQVTTTALNTTVNAGSVLELTRIA